jgi:hypothetical protein
MSPAAATSTPCPAAAPEVPGAPGRDTGPGRPDDVPPRSTTRRGARRASRRPASTSVSRLGLASSRLTRPGSRTAREMSISSHVPALQRRRQALLGGRHVPAPTLWRGRPAKLTTPSRHAVAPVWRRTVTGRVGRSSA